VRFERTSTRPATPCCQELVLDYEAAVGALTLQFLNENEATRVAALSWLLMLQTRAPRKVGIISVYDPDEANTSQALAAHDGTFPALLKTLSDPSDTVVTRDLQLLSQISKNSDDSYFTFFMVNLLKLFCTDRRLLETRGNLIIRQLCVNLSPERIYRTMADCLEKDEDVEFASIMVQNLNNNLITAPELADLRKKLRTWDTRDSQALFVTLFRSWCHNAVATISLCLLAQAYEQAYNLLQIFADIEMTVNMLIQIDKLVQLLESPVFTYLRLQLLEPERYPYLYRCLYGILMLLPQSAAFAALKNRLNSVSAIGYLHMPTASPLARQSQTTHSPSSTSSSSTSSSTPNNPSSSSSASTNTPSSAPLSSQFERRGLKSRDDKANSSTPNPAALPWSDLLEKFRTIQDRARRRLQGQVGLADGQHSGEVAGADVSFGSSVGSLDGTASTAGMVRGVGAGADRRLLGAPGQAGRTLTGMGAAGGRGGRLTPTMGLGMRGISPEKRAVGSTAPTTTERTQSDVGKDHGHRSKFSASHLGRLALARGKSFSGGVSGALGGVGVGGAGGTGGGASGSATGGGSAAGAGAARR